MKKGAKKKGVSKAGRKTAFTSSASKNDEAMVETKETSTQKTQPSQEAEEMAVKVESTPAVEVENKEEAKEEENSDSDTHQEKNKNESQNDKAKGAPSLRPQHRRRKRKIVTDNETPSPMVETTETATQETQSSPESGETAVTVESKPAVEGENKEEAKEEPKPDSETHHEQDDNASPNDKAKGAPSSRPEHRRRKRKIVTKNETPSPMVETKETATQEAQPSQEAEETATQETQPSQEAEEAAVIVVSKPAVEGENEEEAKEESKPDDSETHQEKDENASHNDEAKGASSSQPDPRRGKRKRATKNKTPTPRAKRPRTAKTKPKEAEPEYLKEKRSLEDLWKDAFPVGTEWDQLDALHESNWDFTNVEEALEEGGRLYGKRVYVFGCTESQLVPYKNENKTVLVPAVVCIESSIPPSDKIGVASVQGEVEEIIPMKDMKMAWVPYIPLDKRDRQVDRINLQISILGCTQRRSALKFLKEDRVKKFIYCLPYIDNPFKEDESEQSTVVQITFPSEPPVVCKYDWAKNDIEEITDNLIREETLLPEQKDEFMDFVKEQSDKAETANEEAKQAREKTKEGMSEETIKAYKEMKFYKFYPLPSPDTPDAAGIKKSPFINRYFGNAHEVL